jgi:multicomponent Na+:H+ antiporter subunit G
VAAIGILRLPDALSRQHAATQAAVLAVALCAAGLALIAVANGWGWGWTLRLGLMVVLLVATLPLASHALARSGLAERRAGARREDAGT